MQSPNELLSVLYIIVEALHFLCQPDQRLSLLHILCLHLHAAGRCWIHITSVQRTTRHLLCRVSLLLKHMSGDPQLRPLGACIIITPIVAHLAQGRLQVSPQETRPGVELCDLALGC